MKTARTTYQEIHRYMQRFTISVVVIFAVFMNGLFLFLQLQEERKELKPVLASQEDSNVELIYTKNYHIYSLNEPVVKDIKNNLHFGLFYREAGERYLAKSTHQFLLLKGLDVILHKQVTLLIVTIISILIISIIACRGSKKLVKYVAHNINLVIAYIQSISGTSVPASKNIRSLPDNDELQCIVTTVREKNEEIQAHISHLQRVIAYIQHEFNTPLTSLQLRTEELEDDASTLAKHLPKIQSSVKHLSGLIQALTQIIKTTHASIEHEKISLQKLSEDVWDELDVLHKEKNVTLSITTQEDITVTSDYFLVRTIWRNLMHNAIKYSPEASKVEVILSESSAMIKDHGPGINKDNLQNIWLPFWQGDRSRGVDEGFGLGLSLVRTITDKLGWRVNVLSSGNLGTTFILERPTTNAVPLSNGR